MLAVVLVPAVHTGFAGLAWPQTVPRHPPVGWFDTATLALLVGWAVLTLHLIARSGRPPAHFGLARPQAVDVAWATGLFGVCWWAGGLTAGLGEVDRSLFPRPPVGVWEVALVVGTNAAVGFTEELVWRAYLLTRLEELTGSAWQAVALTGLLFGLTHLYQGPAGLLGAGLQGLLAGAVFVLTRRLAPVALEHAAYDVLLATWDC